mgnify:CR=1 FL=1|jgi:hypothetical protein
MKKYLISVFILSTLALFSEADSAPLLKKVRLEKLD